MELSRGRDVGDYSIDGRELRAVVDIIEQTTANDPRPVSLHEPQIGDVERYYVTRCLESGYVSSIGEYVTRFETALADYTGAANVVATVNGTAALHLSLLLIGVRPGDEVLVPALTFVATANAVAYCAAVPHFIDSSAETLGVDPAKLAAHLESCADVQDGVCRNRVTGRRIRAVVAVHVFGCPVDMDPLIELARTWGLRVVEDAAESLGSEYRSRMTGTLGDVACLSFNGNKIITTGGGGAVLTNCDEIGVRARHLATTAKQPHRWAFDHDEVGFNYRMPNLNAALGCAQIERLDELLRRKRALAARYGAAFDGLSGVELFEPPAWALSNYWLNALLLDETYVDERDTIMELCHSRGILVRPAWELLSELPMYREYPRMDLSLARNLARRIICLPSSPSLGIA